MAYKHKELQLSLDDVCRLASSMNKAFCDLMGDATPLTYDELTPEAQSAMREAASISMVRHITPKQSHENWVKARKAEGWIYGKTKDNKLKTHPNLIDYDELSPAQKFKDVIFLNICIMCFPYVREIIE